MTLVGPTVALVPLSLDQLHQLLKHSSDPILWTYSLRPPPLEESSLRQEIELALAQKQAGERTPFAILHRSSKEYIGSTSLWNIDKAQRTLEIGSTWLGAAYHGTGINQECKSLLLSYAFEKLNMMRVVFQTDELNLRSRRAIEKLGATFEGVLRNDKVTWNGRVRSSAIYGLLVHQFRPSASLSHFR